jgi:hypothetical protein
LLLIRPIVDRQLTQRKGFNLQITGWREIEFPSKMTAFDPWPLGLEWQGPLPTMLSGGLERDACNFEAYVVVAMCELDNSLTAVSHRN